ncbi:hypothetical protein CR983_01075 [Candidatus Saccharibacteria bacterium]|nr:MAG: hypothetical protein CR983_01075 [Candidatus Saccharibacteria bacterium]
MKAYQSNDQIVKSNQTFWAARIKDVSDTKSLNDFVAGYLSLLGEEYEDYITNALSHLDLITEPVLEKATKDILTILDNLKQESSLEQRKKLWQKLAELVNYSNGIVNTSPQLTDREQAAKYIKTLLDNFQSGLWPEYDVAYRIVNVMAYYSIEPADTRLYKLWDLATELEIPNLSETDRKASWQTIFSLAKQI